MKNYKNLKNVIIVILFTFFLNILVVNAASTGTIRTNDGWGVLLRSTPSAINSTNKAGDIPENATVTILDTNAGSGNNCSNNWYQISYSGKTGYVCSTWVVVNTSPDVVIDPNGDFEQQLRSSGFPESYWPYLKVLHQKYPNWRFEALNVSTTFDNMVQQQYTLGKNLIQNPGDGWKRVDTYLYDEDRFRTDFRGGGSSWYAPSEEVIRYYLDPRNFLNEYDIFMFEKLSFNSTFHTKSGTSSLLSQTFMNGNTIDGTNDNYADIFMDSATSTNTSPYFLSARIIQEVGYSRSAIVSGTVSGYEGYYNFYNIDATGSSDSMTNVRNGLRRAISEGWNTERKAITGGARIISADYIGVGQDTLYNQKFDMINFWHQYQQNIEAPIHEGSKMRGIYNKNNFLSSSFVFRIPVYASMPSSAPKPNTGNPINALKNLKVNGNTVSGFNRDTKSYTVYVAGNSTRANISATPHVSSASVSGTGDIALSGETTVKDINVTAQNGSVNTYRVTLIKSASSRELTVDEIMPKVGVKYNNTYISGINIGTDVSTLVNNIKKQSAGANVTVKNCNGNIKSNGAFATGDTVSITSGGTSKTYSIVIYGDVSGDGVITVLDLLKVQNIILRNANLSEAYQTAADVSRDGEITVLDLLKIQNDILNRIKITQ